MWCVLDVLVLRIEIREEGIETGVLLVVKPEGLWIDDGVVYSDLVVVFVVVVVVVVVC